MSISCLAIIDKKGKPILFRSYKNDVGAACLDLFNQKLLDFDAESSPSLIVAEEQAFFFLPHQNLTLLALTRENANALMVFTFLGAFLALLLECFTQVDAERVRENAIFIYELMDEVIDNGYPLATDFKALRSRVTSTATQLAPAALRAQAPSAEQGAPGAVAWRTGVYKYAKNEAYLDVVERVNMVISHAGQVLQSEVEGAMQMDCRLSGTPELVLGINDKKFLELNPARVGRKGVEILDLKFHQCVRLARFENDRSISFVPPDGKFDLISYRMESAFKSLFAAELIYEKQTETRVHFQVRARALYKEKVAANFVEFQLPVPAEAQNFKVKLSAGTFKYMPENDVIAWRVQALAGKKELNAEVKLDIPSLATKSTVFKNRPIKVLFEIPYYTLSGLNVKYLKMNESAHYKALSWVRYITKNGDFCIRTHSSILN